MKSISASKAGTRGIWHPLMKSPRCGRLHSSPLQWRPQSTLLHRAAPHLPRILQPSMWEKVIPSGLRSRTKELFSARQKRPTNPATFFIWIYILIGSQAIRILQAKNDYAAYSRKADLQIEKLREVVRKLQAGEQVDVEKVLGTGVPEEEEAWEEALKEIEREERIWAESKRKKKEQKRREKEEREQAEKERADANPVNAAPEESRINGVGTEPESVAKPPFAAPGFY